jgi:hypothetical protein
MCRNIKVLYNFEPRATNEEIYASALQFVRKVSGYREPSQKNKAVFDQAVDDVAVIVDRLLDSLTTESAPRIREVEMEKARERARKRYEN